MTCLIGTSLNRTTKEQLIKREMNPISFEANLSNWTLLTRDSQRKNIRKCAKSYGRERGILIFFIFILSCFTENPSVDMQIMNGSHAYKE